MSQKWFDISIKRIVILLSISLAIPLLFMYRDVVSALAKELITVLLAIFLVILIFIFGRDATKHIYKMYKSPNDSYIKNIMQIIRKKIDWILLISGSGFTIIGVFGWFTVYHYNRDVEIIKIAMGVMLLVFGILLYREKQKIRK